MLLLQWADADSSLDADSLKEAKELESVKFSLQEALHDLLSDTYSLIIFADELDRCSPANVFSCLFSPFSLLSAVMTSAHKISEKRPS